MNTLSCVSLPCLKKAGRVPAYAPSRDSHSAYSRSMVSFSSRYCRLISPAFPSEWDGFTMEKVFRGKKLHITVDNLAHKEGNPEKVILNGREREPGVIPESELKDDNIITVVM